MTYTRCTHSSKTNVKGIGSMLINVMYNVYIILSCCGTASLTSSPWLPWGFDKPYSRSWRQLGKSWWFSRWKKCKVHLSTFEKNRCSCFLFKRSQPSCLHFDPRSAHCAHLVIDWKEMCAQVELGFCHRQPKSSAVTNISLPSQSHQKRSSWSMTIWT